MFFLLAFVLVLNYVNYVSPRDVEENDPGDCYMVEAEGLY